MPKVQGVNVPGTIVPVYAGDTYPVIDPQYGIDGWRFATSRAARNAIPNSLRREGMPVYCSSDQVVYQLNPPGQSGWTGTDDDWTVFGNFQPYQAPSFATFQIRSQGAIVVTGSAVGGSVTFIWTDVFPGSIALNSISITDTTTSTVIASGLSDTGSHAATIPTVNLGSPGSHVWTIAATDVKGNAISMAFAVTWVAPLNQTYYVNNATGNDSNNGTSSGTPWLTIQHAVDHGLGPGDTVNIAAGSGPYAGFVLGWNTFGQPSGAAGHPITFNFAAGATINSRNIHTLDAIDMEGNSYITINGATIVNSGTVTRMGIRCSAPGRDRQLWIDGHELHHRGRGTHRHLRRILQ